VRAVGDVEGAWVMAGRFFDRGLRAEESDDEAQLLGLRKVSGDAAPARPDRSASRWTRWWVAPVGEAARLGSSQTAGTRRRRRPT